MIFRSGKKAVTEVIDSTWYLAILTAIPGLIYLTWGLVCGKCKGRIEREMDYLDKLTERVKEMEYKGSERKLLHKFKVGDVVTVRKEAEKYGITVLRYELIVSDILDNGMIKVYIPLSNGGKSAEIVYNPEWLELVRRQGLDIPETNEPVYHNATIMQKWAEESKEFSKATEKLLNEFGFSNTNNVKYQIRSAFTDKYIKLYDKLKTNKYDPDEISVINLAKALLVASAYLETNDITKIIDWADEYDY